MTPFLRLAVLIKPIRREMLMGLALAVFASLANFGLLFLSGWLLAAAAIAGLGGIVRRVVS